MAVQPKIVDNCRFLVKTLIDLENKAIKTGNPEAELHRFVYLGRTNQLYDKIIRSKRSKSIQHLQYM